MKPLGILLIFSLTFLVCFMWDRIKTKQRIKKSTPQPTRKSPDFNAALALLEDQNLYTEVAALQKILSKPKKIKNKVTHA